MELQAATLFTYDEAGRICFENDGDLSPTLAPRFFLGRTRDGHVLRLRHDLPEALARRLEQLVAAEPIADDLRADPRCLDQMRAALASYAPITSEFTGPAFYFPDDIRRPDEIVTLTTANAEVLRQHFPWLIDSLDIAQPCMAIVRWRGGRDLLLLAPAGRGRRGRGERSSKPTAGAGTRLRSQRPGRWRCASAA